jgi:hypothetical protein
VVEDRALLRELAAPGPLELVHNVRL